MFAASYFAPRYFTNSYWTKLGLEAEVPVEPPMVIGGPPRPSIRQIFFEPVNVRVRGKLLIVRCSLIPGEAAGGAQASGDSVLVLNAIADGASFNMQRWELVGGMANSKIILTEDEEIMLILADAA